MKAPIKSVPTFLLKAVIVLLGAGILTLCIFVFPPLWHVPARELPEFLHLVYPAVIALYITPLPFFFALYQAFLLLHAIDKNTAFSERSVAALRKIKYCAIAIGICYAACMPLVYVFAELDDAPGAILIGLGIVCIPLIIATFAAVLQKLVQSAVALKAENDLTV